MRVSPDSESTAYVSWGALVLALGSVMLGLAVLGGWIGGIDTLKSILPGMASMKPNTASGLLLGGCALALLSLRRLLALALFGGGLVALLGLVTLLEYRFGWNAGIDQLLFADRLEETPPGAPGRMSPLAAISFTLTGIALVLMALGRYQTTTEWLAAAVGLLALLPLSGYLFGNLSFPQLGAYPPTAAHTAIGFLLLAGGILFTSLQLKPTAGHGQHMLLLMTVSLGLLLIVGAAMSHSITARQDATDWVEHAYRVLWYLQIIESDTHEQENLTQRFLNTGNEDYLHHALKIRGDLLDALDKLGKSLADPAQKVRLKALIPMFQQRFALDEQRAEARRQLGMEAADRWKPDSQRLDADILTRLEALQNAETRLLSQRKQTAQNTESIARATLGIVLAMGIALLLLALSALRREMARREQNEARLRALFDTTAIGIVVIDQRAIVEEFNRACEALFDYSRQEVVGRNVNLLMPEPHRSAHDGYLKAYLSLGAGNIINLSREVAGQRKDGSVIPLELFVGEARIRGRRTFIGFVKDISERKRLEAKARHFQAIVQSSDDAIVSKTLEGIVTSWNPGAETLYGYTAEEMLGKPMLALFPPGREDEEQTLLEQIKQGFKIEHFETVRVRKDGTPVDVSVSVSPIRDKAGNIVGASKIARDISARRQAEARLRLAANVFTHAREGIMITEADGSIVEVNGAFIRITGYSREDALGQTPRLLKSGRQTPEFYAALWSDLLTKGYWDGEVWNRRKDGEVYAELLTISTLYDAGGNVQNYVALFTDITPLKAHQRELEHIAHYDALTGLPNRVLLADRLRQAMSQAQRRSRSLGVVYLDLDGFKAVNDTHGHDAGDELLVALARRMKAALREGDTLARIGGDEFVAVLIDLEGTQECQAILDRLLQATAGPVLVRQHSLAVSASIGVTFYPQDDGEADQLMRHADQAMYAAKQVGKNRYHFFDVSHDFAAQTLREGLGQIRRALDRQEFVLHYQPKVNMKTGQVIGAEALVRWQHRERGLLPPATFLPLIEDHPMSVELGEWVIDTALAQTGQWRAAGLNLPVSVNVGARQLQQDGFASRLSALLAAHPEIRPASLELEILETSALEDVGKVSDIMRACAAIGVRFALDDFGTGYSSLSYLKRLPASQLKIDQSFVRDMLDDPDDLAIIEAVVGLADAFRRQVIAEGLEQVGHGDLLLPLGCDLAQGYAIARPMPGEDLPAWAAAWKPSPTWTAWCDRAPSRDDLEVVYGQVEHRHWLRSLEAYLTGQLDTPPLAEAGDCRLGRWLQTEGKARHGGHPDYARLAELHGRVHALGGELLELRKRKPLPDARPQTRELRGLLDDMYRLLEMIVRQGR